MLEQALGRQALHHLEPMQTGDVESRAADTSALEEWVGFAPCTPLEEGVDVLGVLANQPVVRGSGGKGYGYGGYGRYGDGNRSGYGAYAEAAEKRERLGNGVEPAPEPANEAAGGRNGKRLKTSAKKRANQPLAVLRDGSKRLMHWLDERE